MILTNSKPTKVYSTLNQKLVFIVSKEARGSRLLGYLKNEYDYDRIYYSTHVFESIDSVSICAITFDIAVVFTRKNHPKTLGYFVYDSLTKSYRTLGLKYLENPIVSDIALDSEKKRISYWIFDESTQKTCFTQYYPTNERVL